MKAISENTRAEVWYEAIRHLIKSDGYEDLNLILEVKSPSHSDEFSKAIERDFDILLKQSSLHPLHTVAETIFPAALYKKYKRHGVFEIYPNEIFPRIKNVPSNRNGTYAYRLVRGVDPKGVPCNPLAQCLSRMENELTRNNAKKPVYEVSLDAIDSIPVYRNDKSYMGFPCLSHLSFKLCAKKNKLHLTAIYRSQYYVTKALGNLLGLARLQAFMARELGIQPGDLVCHSTFAKLDFPTGLGKARIEKFIRNMDAIKNETA